MIVVVRLQVQRNDVATRVESIWSVNITINEVSGKEAI